MGVLLLWVAHTERQSQEELLNLTDFLLRRSKNSAAGMPSSWVWWN